MVPHESSVTSELKMKQGDTLTHGISLCLRTSQGTPLFERQGSVVWIYDRPYVNETYKNPFIHRRKETNTHLP